MIFFYNNLKKMRKRKGQETSSYTVIGDYDNGLMSYVDCKNPREVSLCLTNLQNRVAHIERFIYLIEQGAQVVKSTPLSSMLYMDMASKKRIDAIYNNWIEYMTGTSRSNQNGLSMEDTFWNIDRYIFKDFFRSYLSEKKIYISFLQVSKSKPIDSQLHKDLASLFPLIISQDRDESHQLRRPNDHEYISCMINDKNISLTAFQEEIQQLWTNAGSRSKPGNLKCSDISLSYSIVNRVNNNLIGVRSMGDNTLSTQSVDRRVLTLGSGGTLYNTVVRNDLLEELDGNLCGMGLGPLRMTLILYHAMLHLKCDMTLSSQSHSHDHNFISEFINYTPSVFYGHHLFPPLTIADGSEAASGRV